MKANMNEKINRRDFLKVSAAAGTGLLISVYLSGCQAEPVPPEPTRLEPVVTSEPSPKIKLKPNAFLMIDTEGQVTIIASKPELGQGTRTALPMIVAEELEVDWKMIRIEQAPAGDSYEDQSVGGSDSIFGMYNWLREAGATARGLLVAAAAKLWEVDVETCYAQNGMVIHEPSGNQFGYGELVTTAAEMEPPRTKVKDSGNFRLIGTRVGRVDNPQIVDGSAIFASDVTLPGMLYAVMVRPPHSRIKVESYDDTKALAVPGVRHVVRVGSGIAIVAENTWQALKGREALMINWSEGQSSIPQGHSMEIIEKKYPEYFAKRNREPNQLASLDHVSLLQSANSLSLTYTIPHFAHAAMEPMNCVADVHSDSCVVWAPTQVPMEAKSTAHARSGVADRNDVQVNIPLIGGGFGRRLEVDYVDEAVLISRAVGAPIKLFWTREDDIRHDFFHPKSSIHVQASLVAPEMPRLKTTSIGSQARTGAWRSVWNFDEAFARECFMDEYAEALGLDPVDLRLTVYEDERLKAVLERVAAEAGWGTSLPQGWGRGVACFSTWDMTPVAEVAEVSIEKNGRIRVHRVACAVDCGIAVNPDMVEQQMEGGIAFALSAVLGNEITLEDGRVQQSNFDDYPILRMDEMPVVETHIIPGVNKNPWGVGEMGVPSLAPAVANAVYAITGQRIRQLPIRL